MHVPRILFRRSMIRVISANATQRISDSLPSHYGSYTTDVSTNDSKGSSWKPLLENFRKTAMGIETTIVWPDKVHENGTLSYVVNWNSIDALDITGHLHTPNNVAVLTLTPNSRYWLQVSLKLFTTNVISY